MSEIEKMIDEMRYEAASTAKILERIPVDKFDWKPHQKSMSMKDLATHVAGLAEWPGLIASTDFLDFAAGTFKHPQINNTNDLLKVNNEGLEKSVEALKKMTTMI
ncbi:MAG: hypothetical protein IT238_10845 [Bacteroidia bacterium]|nr:hypothetical protein [Bacteroidia bacterium]MCZ2248067.1 hypothetical protein [Bacteroidia bacterium]